MNFTHKRFYSDKVLVNGIRLTKPRIVERGDKALALNYRESPEEKGIGNTMVIDFTMGVVIKAHIYGNHSGIYLIIRAGSGCCGRIEWDRGEK